MLEVNVNSYVDIAKSDFYVENNYTSNAPIAVHWGVLNDKEKEAYLRASMLEIEQLKYAGRPYRVNQPLKFPRVISLSGGYVGVYARLALGEVPELVMNAQIENALGIILKEINSITDKQFMTLQSLGAVKNTKYNKREAGDIGFGDELKGGMTKCPISSVKAYKALSAYIGGGYSC